MISPSSAMRTSVSFSGGPTVSMRMPALRPVAADHRPGLGLAVALEQGQAERVEEQPDLGIERRAARDHRLDPPAEPAPTLRLRVSDRMPSIGRFHGWKRPGIFARADRERAVEQIFGQAALLDVLQDAGAEHFEQARARRP